ncbi:MAG: ABC transporter substrate-binding protein [Candidatus Rokuibacteriota bacterium]
MLFWSRIGLAYRTDEVKVTPQSWKDLWNDAYAGRRGTYTIGNSLGINFLFMASRLWGKDFFDIDAGVEAVKRLQPKLVDFTGTMEQHLTQKEVVIAVLHDGAAWDLQKRGVPVSWVAPVEGVPILDQVCHVTRGSKNRELAWKFVDAFLSPEVQLAWAQELFFSPTNRTVKLPADVASKIISGPADVEKLLIFDWAQIARQRPAWTEKWNRALR